MNNLNDRKRISLSIKEERIKRNISQVELAEKTGLSQSYIYRIENGTISYGIDILLKIASAMDMKVKLIPTAHQNKIEKIKDILDKGNERLVIEISEIISL